ncbi:hypothetical protein B0H16DRAFT_1721169 [Mycena metata]|uniref:Uncharacterized protein n=1 Tax=Mycena metata TaxID=1033252 RepID=A0AAD7J6A3_9AGAR|nr:hypothetical protein B0H16DRAFT_1721169 [Mycena metata]
MSQNNSPAPVRYVSSSPLCLLSSSPYTVHTVFVALGDAFDTLSARANTIMSTQMADLPDAMDNFEDAAEAVENAHDLFKVAIDVLLPATTGHGPCRPGPRRPAPVARPQVTVVHAPAQASSVRFSAPWAAGFLYGVVPPVALSAVPDNGGKWFAITRGSYIGLTQNSAISLHAVSGYSTALSEKFSNQTDALDHFNAALASGALAIVA